MLLLLPFSEDQGWPVLPAYALAPYSYFHCAYGFFTRKLACVLDSLVRVSRRIGENRFGRIVLSRFDPLHFCYSDLTTDSAF